MGATMPSSCAALRGFAVLLLALGRVSVGQQVTRSPMLSASSCNGLEQVRLGAGESLFVPRRTVHSARAAASSFSAHLTVSDVADRRETCVSVLGSFATDVARHLAEEDADEPTDGGDPADDTKKGLGNPHLRSHQSHITLLGSTSTPQLGGCSKRFRIVVPRIPSYFTGTGDLCAALLLAWSPASLISRGGA